AHTGSFAKAGAADGSPPPQIGTAAANRPGKRVTKSHVPKPPIDIPMTEMRVESTGSSAVSFGSNAMSSPIGTLGPFGAACGVGDPQSTSTQRYGVSHCGASTKHVYLARTSGLAKSRTTHFSWASLSVPR